MSQPAAKTYACHVCPGLVNLAARRDIERILINARRGSTPDDWTWTVDIVTDLRDGHATAATLDAAMHQAVAEIA